MPAASLSPPLPLWVRVPAAAGIALVLLPLLAMTLQVDWARFPALIGSEASRAALALSLRTAAASTVLCVLLGVPMATVLARSPRRGTGLLRGLVLIPLVLPPVVSGLALLSVVGRQGLLGAGLEVLGVRIAFTTAAVVLAQTFVALPFLVLSLEGALRAADTGYEQAAATLGAGPTRVLLGVTLPLVAPSLLAGVVLSFARALGEFGATITVAGSLQGTTRTLPLEIYLQREADPDAAIALSFLLILVAAAVIALVRRRGVR